MEAVRPLTPKVVQIGGLGLRQAFRKPAEPLDARWKRVYAQAKKGVVYMSFGSMAESVRMTPDMKHNILRSFSEFPDVQVSWFILGSALFMPVGMRNLHPN